MKRIKEACIWKTIHFLVKDGAEPAPGAAAVKAEVAAYKAGLERRGTKYQILEETCLPDGSISLEIKMEYNGHPVGEYWNARLTAQ